MMTTQDQALVALFAGLDTPSVSDALDTLGLPGQCLGIAPLDNYSAVVVGPAFTVQYVSASVPPGTVGGCIDGVAPGGGVVGVKGGRAGGTLDEHLHHAPGGAGLSFTDLEQGQLVLHRTAGDPHRAQADFQAFGEGGRGEEVAPRTDHEPHHLAVLRVEPGMLDQVGLHGAVEEGVDRGAGDVAVDVVVLPAGRQGVDVGVVVAFGCGRHE